MHKIKIGIVEDEMIIAETIILALKKLGYEVVGAVGDYKNAIEMIDKTAPDLVLLDINLGTKKDGIDLALEIKERFGTPIIFLTANSDAATISRAKAINPLAFLVKPFVNHDLYAAIEIGFYNYNNNLKNALEASKHLVLKVGNAFEKVLIDEVIFLKSEQNYIMLNLVKEKKLLVRYTAKEMLEQLPDALFVKINRTYIVNCNYILKIESSSLFIDNLKLNISKAVKEVISRKMKSL